MKLVLTFLFSIIFFAAQAQTIKGAIKDAEGNPVASTTVSLIKASDSSVIKLAVAAANGTYTFSGIAQGNYRIGVSHVGFLPAVSAPFTLADADVNVPALQLTKPQSNMQDVVVTARKPLVEVKADKTILNVEGTINEAGNDALELLRRSPGVQVDKDDNLSLAGKNGVQVYIDNRPSPLSGQDLANYLKSLQSSQIEAIEIITNPSAKYDAAGNAGIINIRLKRNKAFGTNGSATAGWQVGKTARYNGSLNLNHRNKNINVYGTYSSNFGTFTNSGNNYRSVGNEVFEGPSFTEYKPQSQSFKIGMDYTINKQSSIGAIVNGMITNPEVQTSNTTKIIQKNTNTVVSILEAANTSDLKRDNYNINLNYNFTGSGTDGKSLVINADKGYFNNNNDQYQPNYYYDATGTVPLRSLIYHMLSPTEIDIYSSKVDYEQKLGKGKLGIGGKIAFVNTDNDFRRFNVVNGSEELDRDRSNIFGYKETIGAGYVNYNRPFKGITLQLGLRVENTVSSGNSTGQKKVGSEYKPVDTSFTRNYVDAFPSAAISFSKNPMSMWSLSYSRRIDRPSYQDLNPFEFKMDEYTTAKGNTDLRPQYTNSFALSNTYKFKLTTSLNYSHVSNLFTQLVDTAEVNKAIITKRNLAKQDVISASISYPFNRKALTIFANVTGNYSMYKANFGNGRNIDLNAFGLTAVTQASYKFAKTWTAEGVFFYNAPTIYQGTFKAQSMWMFEPGVQKQLFGGKGNLKASVGDVFKSIQFKATSDFAGQVMRFNAVPETRMFKLNFTYRFGSATVKAAKQKLSGAEDELKRAQSDAGGGIGPVKQ